MHVPDHLPLQLCCAAGASAAPGRASRLGMLPAMGVRFNVSPPAPPPPTHQPPPVGEPFELHGLILRSTLLHLLRSRRGFLDPQANSPLLAQQQQQRVGSSGGQHFPGGAVLANGSSADYAAAAAAAQLE